MIGKTFMNKIANDKGDFIQQFLDILEKHQLAFCLIGGLAVNAYAEPVVSLDLDVVVVADQIDELVATLSKCFSVSHQPHSINVSSSTSDIRVQLQTDPRYQEFIKRASGKTVLGYEIPVASLEDVLQGKIWAFSDPTRRPSKRQKDLLDIMRLAETHPRLISRLSNSLRAQVIGHDKA